MGNPRPCDLSEGICKGYCFTGGVLPSDAFYLNYEYLAVDPPPRSDMAGKTTQHYCSASEYIPDALNYFKRHSPTINFSHTCPIEIVGGISFQDCYGIGFPIPGIDYRSSAFGPFLNAARFGSMPDVKVLYPDSKDDGSWVVITRSLSQEQRPLGISKGEGRGVLGIRSRKSKEDSTLLIGDRTTLVRPDGQKILLVYGDNNSLRVYAEFDANFRPNGAIVLLSGASYLHAFLRDNYCDARIHYMEFPIYALHQPYVPGDKPNLKERGLQIPMCRWNKEEKTFHFGLQVYVNLFTGETNLYDWAPDGLYEGFVEPHRRIMQAPVEVDEERREIRLPADLVFGDAKPGSDWRIEGNLFYKSSAFGDVLNLVRGTIVADEDDGKSEIRIPVPKGSELVDGPYQLRLWVTDAPQTTPVGWVLNENYLQDATNAYTNSYIPQSQSVFNSPSLDIRFWIGKAPPAVLAD